MRGAGFARIAAIDLLEPGLASADFEVERQIDEAAEQFADFQIELEPPLRGVGRGSPGTVGVLPRRADADARRFDHGQVSVEC